MLYIRIKSMNKEYEEPVSLRQLNSLLGQLVNTSKEITIGKWSERKSELLDIDVFEKGHVAVYQSNQEIPDGV